MPEEQWTPVQLTGELVVLDISAVPGFMVPGKAVPGVGGVVSQPVTWTATNTEE